MFENKTIINLVEKLNFNYKVSSLLEQKKCYKIVLDSWEDYFKMDKILIDCNFKYNTTYINLCNIYSDGINTIYLTLNESEFNLITDQAIKINMPINDFYFLLDNNELYYIKCNEMLKKYNLKYTIFQVGKPDYNNCILNVISSISKNKGFNCAYPSNLYLDRILKEKKFNHIILILLDGMGVKVIKDNLTIDSFIMSNMNYTMSSVYPSTTCAATTSTLSGLAPIESGWTGWENYIKEINRNVELFTGTDYHTKENLGINIKRDYLPYEEFFNKFSGINKMIMPSFIEGGSKTFSESLGKALDITHNSCESFSYVYWTDPDSTMHKNGVCNSVVKSTLESLDMDLKEFARKIDDDTLIIVTADHGHIDVKEIDFTKCAILYGMLNRRPSNDARCITFSVKAEYLNVFPKVFNQLFHGIYRLYKKDDFINKGFIGDISKSKINSRIDDFLGDYIAVAINKYYFSYCENEYRTHFKGHHAGITVDELSIPLIIYKR